MATLKDAPDGPRLPPKDPTQDWDVRLTTAAARPFERENRRKKVSELAKASQEFSCLEQTQQTSERAKALKDAVNAKDSAGASVLHWAADQGDEGVVQTLLDAGADRNASTLSGYTPLHWAAARGSERVVELLLAGAALPPQVDEKRLTPLHTAALNGRPGVVRQLLAAGFDPQQVDPRGRTPLDLAREHGRTDVVAALTALQPAASGPPKDFRDVLCDVARKGSSGDSASPGRVPSGPSH